MMPSKGWSSYDSTLRSIGERRPDGVNGDLPFLCELGLVTDQSPPRLTESGSRYFEEKFIRRDDEKATAILEQRLLAYPPSIAVAQLLDGVAGANRASVELVLRSQGFGDDLTDRKVGFLVALMDRAGILRYSKRTGAVEILVHVSNSPEPPPSVFVSPKTPFGNRVWIRRVLEECEGRLSWLDKHFTSAAFEVIWEAVDANRVSEVRVMSLYLEDYHSGRKVRRDFTNLVMEFKNRGISLEWRVIDSRLIRDTHDRWIISDTTARNVPNVNAIFSGQHSEMNKSDQREHLTNLFDEYWDQSVDISKIWGNQSA